MATTPPERPNYFLLLELDPDAAWSDAAFAARLDQKKAEWTRGRNHPKHALRYKSYLDMAGDIEAVLSDPVRREAERAAARTLRAAQAEQIGNLFREELDLRAAKGFLTRAEVDALLRDYGPALTQAVVRAAIDALGLEIRADDAPPEPRDSLDPSTMQAIAANLKIVGSTDLYDFLGMVRASRTADLHERAARLYAENQKQATKTALVTARSDLAGQAMTIFNDDDSRRRYDNALDDLAYARLGDDMARITQGSRTIHAAQFARLLERARAQGLDLRRAEHYIRRRAQELQVALVIADPAPIETRLRCPRCGTLADPTAANCPACGTPLTLPCPGCGQTMPTEYRACTACGFPIGNLANVQALLAEADARFSARDYAGAETVLLDARRQWTSAPPRPLRDPLTAALEDLLARVRAEQQAEADVLNRLAQHIDSRRFYAARELLRHIAAARPDLPLDEARTRIDMAIARAEASLSRARQAEQKGEDAVELYQAILWECRDCRPAQEALARTPPAPPGPLTVRPGQRMAHLQWAPSPARGVRYVVVRRIGAPPIAPTDGEMLASLSGTAFDDDSLPIGLPVFYAVYSDREGVRSAEGARTPEPVLLTADVEALAAQVDDGLVRLRWQPPPNAATVIVRRGEASPPATPEDGVQVRVFGLSDAADSGLRNGQVYHYTVFALFDAGDGRQACSAGARISATPQPPPEIITGMTISARRSGRERELHVSWPPVSKGEAALLRSDVPPHLRPGLAIPQAILANYGQIIPAPHHQVTLTLTGTGLIYLTPVVLFGEMAYPGPTQSYTTLDDIRDLRVQYLGDALALTWEWPSNCHHTLVVYRHDDYPTADDPQAARIELTRAEYDREGRFLIPRPTRTDYFIVVYAALVQDGQRLIAPGTEPTCRARISLGSRITLTYAIRRQRRVLGRGGLHLILRAEGAGELPELVLVRKPVSPPTGRADGEPILYLPARRLDEPTTTVSIPLDAAVEQLNSYAALFLTDDHQYEHHGGHVRIRRPDQADLKVF
ncbi:MAG: zinc ribbon domain-containing protein [Anaerolineae bacterium]|nr:zinc ribbon domain-containing protein [Anaerolineae bacterium]